MDCLNQIETQLTALIEQVNLNKIAIEGLNEALSIRPTDEELNALQVQVNELNSQIVTIKEQIAVLQTLLELVNRLSHLKDVNIEDPVVGDILKYDGDRWTNVQEEEE